MKHLNEYIIESINTENGIETHNNAERRKELEAYLKGKDYGDYIETLNSMLNDNKAKTLLVDGFGGELGDMKLKFKPTVLTATALVPTQNEIDIRKSVNYPFIYNDKVDEYFKKTPLTINNKQLITFKGEFIIDGHHRWSEVFAFNPNAKLNAFDYSSNEINSIQMLKAVQGAIAAVKADDNNNNGQLPTQRVIGSNIFDFSRDEIEKYIRDVIYGKEVCLKYRDGKEEFVKDNGRGLIEHLEKYVDSIKDAEGLKAKIEATIKYIADNLMQMKENHTPIQGAPERGEMPQTDKASPNGPNDGKYGPNDEGSALNKLKDDKVASGAIK